MPNLDYIDEISTNHEVWDILVYKDESVVFIATSEWPDTSEGHFFLWDAPMAVGWITSYNTQNMTQIASVNTPTLPDCLCYNSLSGKLYVTYNEIMLTGWPDMGVAGEGRAIDVIDPTSLEIIDQNVTPDKGYNTVLGPQGWLYSPSLLEGYYYYAEAIDGVGLIEYELDVDGNIVDHRLIDVGVKKTSEVIYNPLYNEVYINHFGEDPDFVIYDIASETYELIEFTDKIWIHFCLSTDGQKLFFAAPDTNEILTYDLT